MKKLVRILVLILVIGAILKFGDFALFKPTTVRAFGNLIVDFHIPIGVPLFDVNNMMPGDVIQRNVDAENKSDVPRMAVVRGIRKEGIGSDPKIESVLEIVIKDGDTILYGPKKLSEFFSDSQGEIGVQLNFINPSETKTYNFEVKLPESSENEFQGKSVIFDLVFFVITPDRVVINEVYYETDNNSQWVELHNPADWNEHLKNWYLTDNSNKKSILPDVVIKAHGYMLLSKSASVWNSWDEDEDATKINFGTIIGNGLESSGDRLILHNQNSIEMDRMSWGTDTSGFSPAAVNPVVNSGNSTQRVVPGFDTDVLSDWHEQSPPTPGT
ncbi:MAG: lamin tail domain-containing protein [Patescibacteria group bacterium]